MSREDMIRMAREAHLDVYGLGKDREKFVLVVERFASLVAAAEREACASLCDKIADEDGFEGGYADYCAYAIRGRGLQELNKAVEANGEEL